MSADEVGKVIARHHCNLQHVGIQKTLEYLQRIYYGITKEHVKKLLAECVICCSQTICRSVAPLTPIISTKPFERIQIDLIDMRNQPDANDKATYLWILHVKDHFSKFSSLYPLHNKTAEGVAAKLGEWIGHFQAPDILQCDNG